MENGELAVLVEKLKSSSAPARYAAANKLGKLGDKAAVLHLIDALHDEDEKVGDNVIFALGELGDLRAIPHLIKLLKSSKSERLRKSAAKALGMMHSETSVDALIGALKDPDFKVRKSAARSLGQIGDKKAVPALMEAQKDPDYTVVKYVDDALDRIQS